MILCRQYHFFQALHRRQGRRVKRCFALYIFPCPAETRDPSRVAEPYHSATKNASVLYRVGDRARRIRFTLKFTFFLAWQWQ